MEGDDGVLAVMTFCFFGLIEKCMRGCLRAVVAPTNGEVNGGRVSRCPRSLVISLSVQSRPEILLSMCFVQSSRNMYVFGCKISSN